MKHLYCTPEERQKVREWMEDEKWIRQERFADDEDYLGCVWDILEHPVFQSMDNFIQHGRTTCKEHCIRVSYLSFCLCRKMGWDGRSAARAALLHDLFLYDWHTHAKETGNHFHGLTHPRVALENASRYFALSPMEKNCILRHMWPLTPVPPASKEGFVICYADKVCSLAETGHNLQEWILIKTGVRHDNILGKTM